MAKVGRPFAYCCAEAGGHVEACDCVNKDHGTAWFEVGDPEPVSAEWLQEELRRVELQTATWLGQRDALIAELLEALKALTFEAHCIVRTPKPTPFQTAIDKAEHAIAKAEQGA